MNGLAKRGEEWKRNISLSRANKVLVNNGIKCKYIDMQELNKYIDNGWKRGRIKKMICY